MAPIMETYIELNKVSTKISTVGKKMGESFTDNEDLVIVIPGNPGVNSFYDKFANRIHEKLKCSVWCVGHAGHNLYKSSLETVPTFQKNKELYGLKGQIKNKIDFFEKYIPENARVHLVGHSIGAYVILDLLDIPAISKRVTYSYLLFPTVEYMAKTRNGKILTNYVKYIVWLLVLLSGLFSILPRFIQTALIYGYLTVVGMPKYNCDSIRELIKPSVLKRVFFLAYEEMEQIHQRNNGSIENNLKKIKWFYGKQDGWTPMSFYDNIKKDFPDIDAEITTFNHSFVLDSSIEIGDIVSDWITSRS